MADTHHPIVPAGRPQEDEPLERYRIARWIPVAVPLLALLVATFAAPAVPIVLIFSYLFQNLFVALVSPAISNMDQFNAIRAYNFILTAVIWIVVAWTFWTARWRRARPAQSG